LTPDNKTRQHKGEQERKKKKEKKKKKKKNRKNREIWRQSSVKEQHSCGTADPPVQKGKTVC
jgi:hypothetical protein